MMISSALVWGFSTVNIFATILNIRKIPASYFLWSLCNIFWLVFDIWYKMYPRAILDVINLTTSIWGFVVWSRKSKHRTRYG